jgi:Right handed beta helix region
MGSPGSRPPRRTPARGSSIAPPWGEVSRACTRTVPVAGVLALLLLVACGGQSPRSGSPAGPVATPPGVGSKTAAQADLASIPGEPAPEPATFLALAVRWPVRGDANGNATIRARYRPAGEANWREALPLFRTHPDKVSTENRVPGGWLFAGSIVELAPGTEYEVHLRLDDPDGGSAERLVRMRTAAEPVEPPGMRTRHVVPGDGGGTGTPGDPFRGLTAAQAAAAPGHLFLLAPGVYAVGQWTIDRSGDPGRPIVYRAATEGTVVLDGLGQDRLVSAPGVRHVWLEGLTFRNARYLFVGHRGSDLVIRRSRFEIVQIGIEAINGGYAESRGFVITDNVFTGPSTWPRRGPVEPVNAITVSGAGHVIAWNRITGVGDGIHGTGYGRLSASDIHGNDVEACTDDAVEADHSDTNVRVSANRITNCFAGVSAQPVNGGPLYVFRNAILNVVYSPFKLHNDTAGVVLLHNTSVTRGIPFLVEPDAETVSDVITRNNLFVGTASPALRSTGRMIRCDFDRDGYGWPGGPFALWNESTYATAETARASGALYAVHGAVVLRAAGNFASGLEPPADTARQVPAAENDPRLAAGSRAVDAGIPLPNVSEGFAGRAPDLGCCELGRPLPPYGPRPEPTTSPRR